MDLQDYIETRKNSLKTVQCDAACSTLFVELHYTLGLAFVVSNSTTSSVKHHNHFVDPEELRFEGWLCLCSMNNISVSGLARTMRVGEIVCSTTEPVLTSIGHDIPHLRTVATWFAIFKRGL
jgi:hypothetical protein